MEIQKIFSNVEDSKEKLYSVLMSEEELNLFQREYGIKSKALAVVAPGAYQAKEAAKYAYDNEEDYKKNRGKYALKGLLTPGTATVMKKKAEKMAKQGKSKKEIREYLENAGTGRIVAGTAEALTGGFGGLGNAAAQGVGLYDKITKNRAKVKKSENK